MANHKYNGWTNYETWNVSLWIMNDEYLQTYYESIASDMIDHDDTDNDDIDENIDKLADIIESDHDDRLQESLKEASVFSDLLRSSLRQVNWREIAEHYLEDCAKS